MYYEFLIDNENWVWSLDQFYHSMPLKNIHGNNFVRTVIISSTVSVTSKRKISGKSHMVLSAIEQGGS